MAGFRGIFELAGGTDDRFEGAPAIEGGSRVYGGHMLTQALLACFHTLKPTWECYSLQAQFIRMANPERGFRYVIDRSSDSRNFAVRHVKVTQEERVVMTMTASFQLPHAGDDFQSVKMPAALRPEGFVPEGDRYRDAAEALEDAGRSIQQLPSGIDGRWTDPQNLNEPVVKTPENLTWLRITEPVSDDPQERQLALAYSSDFAFLEAALRPHGYSWVNPKNLVAGSLDHSIWFHRATDMTQWHLSASRCVSTHGGRGFVRGELFDPDGALAASLAQEGILRLA